MMSAKYLSFAEISIELDVSVHSLRRAWHNLNGFPKPIVKNKQQMLFLKAEVLEWMNGRDVKTLIWDANSARERAKKEGFKAEPPKPFNLLAKRFLSGRFLPAAQQQQIAFKKLVARKNKPKTHRQRLVFAWMLDDKQSTSRITHG